MLRDFFKQYQPLFLGIFLLLLPIYEFVHSKGQRAQISWIDQIAFQAIGRSQSHFDGLFGSLKDYWERYIDLVDVQAENQSLRRENARLREENIRLQGVLQENARLSKLAGFKKSHPALNLVPARVIAADITSYFRVIRIRIDIESSKVKVGMPVVSADGVVGQIETIHGHYGDVMLAVDPRSHIDVLTQSNRARGILRGMGDERHYLAQISYLLRRDEVEPDDIVVTSGRGGRFPKELLVGRIHSIDKQSFGLYQVVQVEPAVDFSRLEEVYVITNHFSSE